MRRSDSEGWKRPMRTVVVTGATRGLGKALVEALAGSGRPTVALGQDVRVLEELRAVERVQPLVMDLTDRDALRDTLAGLDVGALIHTEQLIVPGGRVLDMPEGAVDALLEVNLSATIHLTMQVARNMARRKAGRVLFLLPKRRTEIADENAAAAVVNDGVRAFARCLELEVRERGVAVEIIEFNPVSTAASADEPGKAFEWEAADLPAVVAQTLRRVAIRESNQDE